MRARSLLAVACVVLGLGCDGEDGALVESPLLCVPGESRSCTGPAGCSGGQTCAADGRSYGACACAEGETPQGDEGKGAPPGTAAPKADTEAPDETESREDQCDRLVEAIRELDAPDPDERLQANADTLRTRAERVAGLRFGDPEVSELQEIYVELVKDLANALDKTGDALDRSKPGEALEATEVPAYEQRDAAFVDRLNEVCGS